MTNSNDNDNDNDSNNGHAHSKHKEFQVQPIASQNNYYIDADGERHKILAQLTLVESKTDPEKVQVFARATVSDDQKNNTHAAAALVEVITELLASDDRRFLDLMKETYEKLFSGQDLRSTITTPTNITQEHVSNGQGNGNSGSWH